MKYKFMFVSEAQFDNLSKLIKYVYRSRRSNFYRCKYKAANFDPLKDFRAKGDIKKIPFLLRGELSNISPDDRLYVSFKLIRHVTVTSGTSGVPVVIYKTRKPHRRFIEGVDRSPNHIFPSEVRRVFASKRPSSIPEIYNGLTSRGKLVYFANQSDIKNEVRIAKALKVDGLVANPETSLVIAKHLGKIYDLKRIKFIRLFGRKTTTATGRLLKKFYPRATMLSTYGMNEVGTPAIQCKYLAKKSFNLYHTFRSLIYEIIPDESFKNNRIGELVITSLDRNRPTPIIRFRTGDLIELIPNRKKCRCGKTGEVLRFMGRARSDTAQIGREFLIRNRELENSILSLPHDIYGAQVFLREKIYKDTVKPALIFKLKSLSGKFSTKRENGIKRRFGENMRLFFRHKTETTSDNPPNLFQAQKLGHVAYWKVIISTGDDSEHKGDIIDQR